jgi:glycosyltransferase involved in cell wall biosynthesis
MRVLLVTHFFPPSDAIAAQRTLSFAKYWADLGHDVTVLTTKKSQSIKHSGAYRVIETEYLPKILSKKVNTVKSRVLNSPSKANKSPIKTVFNYLNSNGAFSSIRFPDITTLWPFYIDYNDLSKSTYDVVISSHGPYSCHQIANKIKKLGIASKWIMDYRDLWTDNYMYPGLPLIRNVERKLEKRYLNYANSVVTVSKPLAYKLRALGAQKVVVVENGFEESEISIIDLKSENIYSEPDKFILSYFGAIYPIYRDPKLICKAVHQLVKSGRIRAENISINFYGSGEALVHQRALEYNLESVIEHKGSVNRSEMSKLQNSADILFLIDDSKEDGVLTTKIFEYLTTKLPIFAIGVSQSGELAKLLNRFDYSHVCRDEDDLADLIESYFNMKNASGNKLRRKDLGAITEYSRSSLAEKFSLEFDL